ncbi:hypothetical protein F2P56_024874, partial [Juglans regia]
TFASLSQYVQVSLFRCRGRFSSFSSIENFPLKKENSLSSSVRAIKSPSSDHIKWLSLTPTLSFSLFSSSTDSLLLSAGTAKIRSHSPFLCVSLFFRFYVVFV